MCLRIIYPCVVLPITITPVMGRMVEKLLPADHHSHYPMRSVWAMARVKLPIK